MRISSLLARVPALVALLVARSGVTSSAEPLAGYHAQVAVAAPTRLDWIFAAANQSPAEPPADWLPGFESTAQKYELFVPESPVAVKPVILFISAGDQPAGWRHWENICRRAGIIFASPFGAGNSCPGPKRARIVLDVLDDIARRHAIDPDRVYLAGFSGGARVACSIAFALPEYFGGVIAVCGAEHLREESWLRQRVVDRLSVALVTGENDFNRQEIGLYREPLLAGVGVRTKRWTVPGLGHALPDEATLAQTWEFVEQDLPRRRQKVLQFPAMRIGGAHVPTREQWAEALLEEGKRRLEVPTSLYTGLMLLQGLTIRWPDVPAAKEAYGILTQYDAQQSRPWEVDFAAEQRRYLIAEARALERYGRSPLPAQYETMRGGMLQKSIDLWHQVRATQPGKQLDDEAKAKILDIERVLDALNQ